MPPYATTHDRILRRPEVESRVGIGRSALYAMIQRGEFPAPVQLTGSNSGSAVGWRESEVEAWIKSRPSTTNRPGNG